MGYQGDVSDFRRVLAPVKAEQYADWTDEGLIVTRDEAGHYCAEVRKRLSAPRLTRSFMLTAVIGLRKNGGARPRAVASLANGHTD